MRLISVSQSLKRGIGSKMIGETAQPQVFFRGKLRKYDEPHWDYVYMYIIYSICDFFKNIWSFLRKFFSEKCGEAPGKMVSDQRQKISKN